MNELVERLPVMAWFVSRKTEDGKPFSNSLRFYDDNGPNTVSEPLVRHSDAEARISDLQAEVERLRGALKPFATAADDAERLVGHDGPMGQYIDLTHLRAARSALEEKTDV